MPYYPPQPVYPQPVYGGHRAGSDKHTNSAHVIIAWVVAVLTVLYMLPWAVAATRGKSNAGAIGLLNFLLGWSVVGWIVALVMACGSHQAAGSSTVVVNNAYPGYYPPQR